MRIKSWTIKNVRNEKRVRIEMPKEVWQEFLNDIHASLKDVDKDMGITFRLPLDKEE